MARNKRLQRKVSTNVPPTPDAGGPSRDTRTSSIFPYSVARPPTDFAPPIPDSAMSTSSPGFQGASPLAIRVGNQDDPFGDGDGDDETVMDPRETPLYARSDWDPTTATGNGNQTAWSRSSYPDYQNENEVRAGGGGGGGRSGGRGKTEMLGDEMSTGGPLTTIYSQSSYASDTSAPPPLPVTEPLAVRKARSPENNSKPSVGKVVDPYITEPGTAWSQTSFQPRASQIGTTIQPRTSIPPPLPQPSHMIPLAGEHNGKPPKGSGSKQLVSNGSYSSALKSAGSRKPSQLVDITELSEGSHHDHDHNVNDRQRASAGYVPMTGNSMRLKALSSEGDGDGVENPFSPMFANAPGPTAAASFQSPPLSSISQSQANAHTRTMHKHNRSTLPSILDLEDLAARPRLSPSQRPHSADNAPRTGLGSGLKTGYSVDSLEPPRGFGGRAGTDSPRLLTPEAQNRLGRMSVATARYSLPPKLRSGNPSRGSGSEKPRTHSTAALAAARSLKKPAGWWKNFTQMGMVKWYRTWRPFITALHTLMAALLLTTAMADQNSGLGWLIKIQAGGLATMPATGGFGLGITGWCQLDEDEVCSSYSKKDFANTEESFTIPEDPTHKLLYPLWVALTTMTWFQAVFALTASFLHFYLFFILHIPFSHLVDSRHSPSDRHSTSNSNSDGGRGRGGGASDHQEKDQYQDIEDEDQVQKEVDIRARCERPPFEEYVWVWWAWWAFRRGPVAHIYALIVGSLSLATAGLGLKLRNDASNAAMPGSVTFGFGGFLPFIVLLMTLDSFICAIRSYVLSSRRSFKLFTDSPEPTPAAILLPPSEKPLALRHRGTRASTFFAAPTTARFSRGQTLHQPRDGEVPPMPGTGTGTGTTPGGGVVDEETQRWLSEYPHDPELVPLMNGLAQGVADDEFVLSEVGLLYFRPDESDPTGAALLVPPNGLIRLEILGDSHIDIDAQAQGRHRHRDYEEMLNELENVFWWVGMEQDIESHLAQCQLCHQAQAEPQPQQHQSERGIVGWKSDNDGSKSTYTGITGWTGEDTQEVDDDDDGNMAVEMAVAMRKANEDAQRPWAG